jgi:hypothetical protein
MTDAPAVPGEPPPGVSSELTWRLAARLFHDHHPEPGCPNCSAGPADPAENRCANCGQPWPCSGRRLAELGLKQAVI